MPLNTACWFQGSPTQYPWIVSASRVAGIWGDGVTDLAGAEEAMLALTGERAELANGQEILELGCCRALLLLREIAVQWAQLLNAIGVLQPAANRRPLRAGLRFG